MVVRAYDIPDSTAGDAIAQIIGQVLDRTKREPLDIRQAQTFVAVGDVADRIAAEFNT